MREELTPLERSRLYFSGEQVDRLPRGLLGIETGCTLYDVSPREVLHSVDKSIEVQNGLDVDFGVDSMGCGPDLKGIGEALGTKVVYPEWGICYVEDPVLKDYAQLESLKNIDIRRQGRMPVLAEVLKRLKDQHGRTHGVDNAIGGPLSTAAAIRGTENLLRDLRKNPEQLHQLLEFTVDVNISWVKYIWNECEATVSIADPVASGSLLGRASFCEFEKPYLKKLCREIVKITGQKPSLHICGKTHNVWNELKGLDISGFSLDNCESLEEFKKAVGDEITIGGNIDPTEVMRFGSPEDVLESLKKCLIEGSDSPKGYVPGAGCQIPLGTPKENLKAFADGVAKYTKGAKIGKKISNIPVDSAEISR